MDRTAADPGTEDASSDNSPRSRRGKSRPGRRRRAALLLALTSGLAGLAGCTWIHGLTKSAPAGVATAASVDLSKDHVLYLVGYSHLDTEWCWNYPQVIREFLPNTLHDNFALFEKYPDYVFNWTGANRYRLIKEYYPDDYEQLKKYIAQGRWVPNGASLEEGDVDIPSPESIIRQVMYGNQFFKREFNTTSNEYMLPDCFGFPASLPTILAHCGITGFSTQKLTWGSAVGIPFNVGRWVGPDGQSVLAALNGGAYDKKLQGDLSHSQEWYDRIDSNGKNSGVYADYCYYGAGDRGGAPDEGSVQWMEQSIKGDGPVRVVSAKAGDMFTRLDPQPSKADTSSQARAAEPQGAQTTLAAGLPTYSGDLLLTQHSAGSATSEAAMKRWNRKNEYLADSAEKASVAAAMLGAQPYPKQRITDAWLRFLPGQFHDIMAGTALPAGYQFAWNDQILALNEFSGVVQEGVGGVARAMDTRAQGVPLVVYNPLSVDRDDIVEAEVAFPGAAPPAAVHVVGPDGKAVPAQVAGRSGNSLKILFLAHVPSVGFATYDVQPSSTPTSASSSLKVTTSSLENARYSVRLGKSGDVVSVYDKAARKEMLSGPARLAFQYERPRDFPAWNMDWDDQKQPPRGYVDGPATVRIVENGPARVALEVERTANGSRFIQTIRLSAGGAGDRVEFSTKIDWRSAETALKAVFPLTVSNPKATYNWGVATIERGNNDPAKYEVPTHEWFDVTHRDGSYGVAVLNDSKYGSDKPGDNTVRLTLLYTPGVHGSYQHQASQDWGRHEMLYALQGHQGDWRQGKTQWEASRLNQPLVAFRATAHSGALGRSFSLIKVNSPNVAVAALKQAEDSDEIVVRLFERDGRATNGVRVSMAAPIVSAREVNGQEEEIGAATVQNGALVFDMAAYRPRAFALKLGKSPVTLTPPTSTPISLPFDTAVTGADRSKSSSGFDESGRTLPAEMLPSDMDCGGIRFKLGPTDGGAKNAVACHGQTLSLPEGSGTGTRRVYLVAATYGGDTSATFHIDGKPVVRTIQDWSGWIGQWDTRLWKAQEPELTYGWDIPLGGLVPGYIKRDTVAWYSDHWRLPDGTNDPYRFCYLYRYAFDLPAGAKTMTLPDNPKVRVLAASVGSNPNEDAVPAQPLYDTLADHVPDRMPEVLPSGGTFHNAVTVTMHSPLYFDERAHASDLHYTVDGTDPGPNSPVYDGDLILARTTTLKVRQIGSAIGTVGGPVRTVRFVVEDHTPPAIVSVSAVGAQNIRVLFSEPVTPGSAEDTGHYSIHPGAAVRTAHLDPDGRTVLLSLAAPLPRAAGSVALTVSGVQDRSENGNPIAHAVKSVSFMSPVVSVTGITTLTGSDSGAVTKTVPDLPIKAGSPWTINMFVYMDKQPEELSILGGFGSGMDQSGTQRYLIKFHNGLHFWGSNIDIRTGKPFDLGRWQMVTATYDGHTVRLYKDGKELKSEPAAFQDADAVVKLGPAGPWSNGHRFSGKIANFTVWNEALPAELIRTLQSTGPGAGKPR